MASTNLHSTEQVDVETLEDTLFIEDSNFENSLSLEHIEHINGEESFFLAARNTEGERPQFKLSIEDAEALNAWLSKHIADYRSRHLTEQGS